jgi:hypothetical protein
MQLDLQENRFYCKWFKIKSSINNEHVANVTHVKLCATPPTRK